ncbi:hypothetical protein F2Q69_00053514 [Brassica cretica]|uniref:CCHC-type domain-containing protein n=1 Tax=Brassica cretica TaxID=69181 RepID=A0A8S9MWA7_BRACR|nr:hypothetical protein F2Q69_00053514 [Brassica cretica]
MSAMKPVVKMYARTTSYGKSAVKTATATRTASSSATRKIPEVNSVSQRSFIPVCHHCGVVGHIRLKCFRLLREKHQIERVYDMRTHGQTCYSCGVQGHVRLHQHEGQTGGSEAWLCIWYKVGDRSVHQQLCQANKKQHRMCCWFYGKVGHKKMECFAREKSRNMAKKVNKTFIKPKRVEEVFLAKSGLLDEIKDETSEEGCISGRSDLKVHEASSLELGHRVVWGTEGKEIKVRHEVMRDEDRLMVKKTTHEGSQVLNKSWSKGSSTALYAIKQGENGDVPPTNAYLMGEKIMVKCTYRGGESTFGVELSRPCGVKMLSMSRGYLESNGVSWKIGIEERGVNDKIALRVVGIDTYTEADFIEREKLFSVVLVVPK